MSAILTLNAGSSSLKFGLYESADGEPRLLRTGQVENIGAHARLEISGGATSEIGQADHNGAVIAILTSLGPILEGRAVLGVGHRIVHGGADLRAPVVLTPEIIAKLREIIPLVPLHQPHNLAAVAAAQAAFPRAIQVGCFDTAFHQGHPFVCDTYGLPRQYYDEGIRRYGFHGLSYDYVSGVLRRDYPVLAAGKTVIAHLGNGASLCALKDGRSFSTTMGFSALDGIAMGTRPGQIDPGVLLYLMNRGMGYDDLTHLLYKESGLKGMSGISHDMRTLLAADDPRAAEALDYYVHRIRREIAALAGEMGGIDGVVFTGGVGEHSTEMRRRIIEGLGFLGLDLDAQANAAAGPRIGTGRAEVLVIPTDEEQVIARAVAAQLKDSAG